MNGVQRLIRFVDTTFVTDVYFRDELIPPNVSARFMVRENRKNGYIECSQRVPEIFVFGEPTKAIHILLHELYHATCYEQLCTVINPHDLPQLRGGNLYTYTDVVNSAGHTLWGEYYAERMTCQYNQAQWDDGEELAELADEMLLELNSMLRVGTTKQSERVEQYCYRLAHYLAYCHATGRKPEYGSIAPQSNVERVALRFAGLYSECFMGFANNESRKLIMMIGQQFLEMHSAGGLLIKADRNGELYSE